MREFTSAELDAIFAAIEIAIEEQDRHPSTEEYRSAWVLLKDELENMP